MAIYRDHIAVVGSVKFPGGTSSALAQEIPTLRKFGLKTIYSPRLRMFSELDGNGQLLDAIEEHGVHVREDFSTVSANTAVVHNPSAFKFETSLPFRIVADSVVLVMHENPVNGVGQLQYDVETVLALIEDASFCNRIVIAPISEVSRDLVGQSITGYPVAEKDWFNIIDLDHAAPAAPKADRRGRHSRPGPEKWPNEKTALTCFPATAENYILGADWVRGAYPALGRQASLYDFGSMPVAQFLDKMDFFIYYHAPAWRESFGRVVAEAIAAGKVVICEKYLARTFGPACIGADPADIDRTVKEYLEQPARYIEQVTMAQDYLRRFSRESFESDWAESLDGGVIPCA